MIKKLTALILTFVMITAVFCACGEQASTSDKLSIVCTVFPYYDWVRSIIGESDTAEVTLLLDNGTDPHSFQPSADDIITVSSADIFIYTGGESDRWAEDIVRNSENESLTAIKLMSLLGENELLCVGGHSHDTSSEEAHSHTYDEHIWLSLENASFFSEEIAKTLSEKDPSNKELYEKNLLDYKDELLTLNASYERIIAASPKDTVVVADRFPFIYLTEAYSVTYHAAFPGCSAESEASFETITKLTEKVNELELSYIIVSETSDKSVAQAVINNSDKRNQQILTLNSIQSVTQSGLDTTYIEIMEENLRVLQTALS